MVICTRKASFPAAIYHLVYSCPQCVHMCTTEGETASGKYSSSLHGENLTQHYPKPGAPNSGQWAKSGAPFPNCGCLAGDRCLDVAYWLHHVSATLPRPIGLPNPRPEMPTLPTPKTTLVPDEFSWRKSSAAAPLPGTVGLTLLQVSAQHAC